jgi:rhamnosyltransferase
MMGFSDVRSPPLPTSAGAKALRAALKASVVIRARNEAGTIGRVLEAVKEQTVKPAEIIVIDSGSTDATVDIARSHDVRLLTMKPGDFTYGGALNFGSAKANFQIVVFLSAHAVPQSRRWLEAMLAPFNDERVAAVFGRQMPHPDCHPIEALEIRRAYRRTVRRYSKEPPFSAANGAVRRELAIWIPFNGRVTYAEDQIWARKICKRGWSVAYAPKAAVYHSHNESWREVFLRQRREIRESAVHLDLNSALKHWWILPFALTWGLARDAVRLLFSSRSVGWFFRAPAYRYAKVMGAWYGFRDAKEKSPYAKVMGAWYGPRDGKERNR